LTHIGRRETEAVGAVTPPAARSAPLSDHFFCKKIELMEGVWDFENPQTYHQLVALFWKIWKIGDRRTSLVVTRHQASWSPFNLERMEKTEEKPRSYFNR